jgi:hypothetical protein
MASHFLNINFMVKETLPLKSLMQVDFKLLDMVKIQIIIQLRSKFKKNF